MAKKIFAQIAKIKNVAARAKADQALDKAKGIKQGSAKDKAIDTKVTKVAKYEYGPKGKYAGKGAYKK